MAAAREAVVVGAGHNGLVAANLLCDAGWNVIVLEQQDIPGGAVRSDRSLHPDFVTDWFSAFYPLAAASPALAPLDLHRWGLRWRHAPAVLAHVFPDDRCAVLSRDRARTAESVDSFAAGDGAAWLAMVEEFERIRDAFLGALFTPFPPVRAGLRLAKALGTADAMRFARFALQSVRRMSGERFAGEGAAILLAGNALHSDLSPEVPGSAIYGWLLCMLGQTEGFPVPVGGSGAIIEALVARLRAGGGTLRTSVAVASIEVRDGRAHGVVLADGERVGASAVLADVGAPHLYRDLVGEKHLPPRLLDDLEHFQWDAPTMKVNWALSSPVPWTAPAARDAGTLHLSVDMDDLTRYAADLASKRIPQNPFLLMGQMTTADPSRSPAGTESAWAYTHLPEGIDHDAATVEDHVRRIEAVIERHAPGFTQSVLSRGVQAPADLQGADANLVGGAVGGGTSNLYQQLIFRPVPGLGRAETPIDGLYLAGASAHPGGGVHGGPGANAARSARRRRAAGGRIQRRVLDSAMNRIYRSG
jgi:phytoene dehydrogenase-like protein